MRIKKISYVMLSLFLLSLTACSQKEDKTETFSPPFETQSEDMFKVDNVSIEVTAVSSESSLTTNNTKPSENSLISDNTEPSTESNSLDIEANSGNENQNVESSLTVPESVELTEEEAVYLDSLVYSSLSDEEITEIINSEKNFTSVSDKESLVEDTLQLREDLVLSEEFEMETIDYSNDEKMLELMEKAEKQLEEDMKKEPIRLNN